MEPKVESKTSKPKSKQNWKPLAAEIGVVVLRGLATGISMQAGIMIFNKSLGNTNNLLLINGGKKSMSA